MFYDTKLTAILGIGLYFQLIDFMC